MIPAALCPIAGLWVLSVMGAESLHLAMYPHQALSHGKGLGTILVTVSPFFGVLPLGMVAGNFIVYTIRGARKALDGEATVHPGTAFLSAQKGLLIAALVFAPVSAALTLYGVFMSWS